MAYKICPKCKTEWVTRDHFLADPELALIGYQVNFKQLKTGILMFNHACKTTLALYVIDFQDLYDGPIFKERATGTDECPGMCLHQDDFNPCPARCECAFVRHILKVISDWPKAPAAPGMLESPAR